MDPYCKVKDTNLINGFQEADARVVTNPYFLDGAFVVGVTQSSHEVLVVVHLDTQWQ